MKTITLNVPTPSDVPDNVTISIPKPIRWVKRKREERKVKKLNKKSRDESLKTNVSHRNFKTLVMKHMAAGQTLENDDLFRIIEESGFNTEVKE